MNKTIGLLASASVVASATLSAPAFAEGTQAGTTITNEVTLTYKVGGVDQTAIEASGSFTVDRKVNFTVAADGAAATSVSPGQEGAVTSFLVTNLSNAPLDLALAAGQAGAAHGGTDNFDVANLRIHIDSNDDGAFDAGDQQVTFLNELAADESRRVFVLADVPAGRATGDVAGVRLTATAAEAGTAGSLGAAVTETSGADTSGMDTVFADTDADGNVARDGAHWAGNDFEVLAAALSLNRSSRVISDPLNGSANPKMIPGAVVEHCIAVANAAGSATATNVAVSDSLPEETSYLSAFGIKVNGTVTGSACNADGTPGGAFAGNTVSATLDDIAAGVTRTVIFRVTVD